MDTSNNNSSSGTVDRLAEILRMIGKDQSGNTFNQSTSIRDLDSLATLDFLLSIEKAFGIDMDAQALFEADAFDTLHSLARFIDNLPNNNASATASR